VRVTRENLKCYDNSISSTAPNQVIRADDLAWAMVDIVTTARQGLAFESLMLENRAIREKVNSHMPPPNRCALTRI
jgi:hypothetical protein